MAEWISVPIASPGSFVLRDPSTDGPEQTDLALVSLAGQLQSARCRAYRVVRQRVLVRELAAFGRLVGCPRFA